MRRDELDELHYIAPIVNVASILSRGILSHRRAQKIDHESVAMGEIQDRRAKVVVPGGRRLHEYANLYVCARNPMLFKRRDRHAELCVLRVSVNVLDLPGVVVTDMNASSDYCSFRAAPGGLRIIDREMTFAEHWTHPDQIEYYRRKGAKCAEVLVPDRVDPDFLIGAYVSCEQSLGQIREQVPDLLVTVNQHLFFL